MNSDLGKKVFIAATAPLQSTAESFWQMILENKVTLVLMLCRDVENDKVRYKQILLGSKLKKIILGDELQVL